jgi:hypothetical protein
MEAMMTTKKARRKISMGLEAEVVGAGVERVDYGDVAQGESGFAVI